MRDDAEHTARVREYELRQADRLIEKGMALRTKHGIAAGGDDDDVATLRVEHEQFRQALIDVDEQRLKLEERLSGDALHVENETLREQGRQRDHFDRFRELAAAAGMKPAAIKPLWRTSGFEASSDDVDHKALGKLLEGMRQEHDYAFDSGGDSPTAEQPAARQSTPSGNGFVFDRGRWCSGN